jgi:hypothetical protein
MNALCMDNLSLGRTSMIVLCIAMHKALIYVLSSVQVLHAQAIHLCPVLSASSPCTRHSFMFRPKDKFSMHINECLVHGELVLRTGYKRVPCAWRTCPQDRIYTSALCMENLSLGTGHKQVLHAQDIHLCPVLSASSQCTRHSFMSCPNAKFSMHKTLSYVLSSVKVLHAQGRTGHK